LERPEQEINLKISVSLEGSLGTKNGNCSTVQIVTGVWGVISEKKGDFQEGKGNEAFN